MFIFQCFSFLDMNFRKRGEIFSYWRTCAFHDFKEQIEWRRAVGDEDKAQGFVSDPPIFSLPVILQVSCCVILY